MSLVVKVNAIENMRRHTAFSKVFEGCFAGNKKNGGDAIFTTAEPTSRVRERK